LKTQRKDAWGTGGGGGGGGGIKGTSCKNRKRCTVNVKAAVSVNVYSYRRMYKARSLSTVCVGGFRSQAPSLSLSLQYKMSPRVLCCLVRHDVCHRPPPRHAVFSSSFLLLLVIPAGCVCDSFCLRVCFLPSPRRVVFSPWCSFEIKSSFSPHLSSSLT